MKRPLFILTLVSTAAFALTQACSSDETTATSDAGTSTSTSSSGGNNASTSSSGDNTSSGGEEDTCVSGGGACVCGGSTTACPNGGTREPSLKCKQAAQGSGDCFRTCCKGGDSGAPPDPDAAVIVEAGSDANDDGG